MDNPPRGFCESISCVQSARDLYRLGQNIWVSISTDQAEVECPVCGYALYWTRSYVHESDLSDLDKLRFERRVSNRHRYFDRSEK